MPSEKEMINELLKNTEMPSEKEMINELLKKTN